MTGRGAHRVLTLLIASVWLGFGLYCKVLGFVPRHEEIVARILGAEHAGVITRAIGLLEVLMGLWVLSGLQRRVCAIVQIGAVAAMNALEAVLAPDLLLWGRANALLALGFIGLIYVHEWVLSGEASS
jgi:uncharacterized membrane protein YphA (DoxX/SURF4 family)